MTPHRRNRRYQLYVPRRHGRPVQKSTGTSEVIVYRAMQRMVQQLKDERRWTVLEAITSKRITLPHAFDALQPVPYTMQRLVALEAELSAVDLSGYLVAWKAWAEGNRRSDVRTVEEYWKQVTTLVQPGVRFPVGHLTRARVTAWLAGLTCSSGTKRKYLYALRSFIRYLRDVNVLETNPVEGITTPKKNPPRKRWVPVEVDQAIVSAASTKYRAFFAFIKATGADVGSAQRAVLGDLYLAKGTTNIRGTKTDTRRVPSAVIEPWAIPILASYTKGMVGPATRLWPTLTESGAIHHHQRCCTAVGAEGYTLKDSRHSIGVRMRKAGKSFEEIAQQLGTSVYHAVTVYAAYSLDTPNEQRNQA